ILHRDIFVADVLDDATVAALGLEADAIFRPVEGDVAHVHVAQPAGRLPADAQPVARAEVAIGDPDVLHRGPPARAFDERFHRDVVIAHAEVAVVYPDVPARWIARIGVGRFFRCGHRHAFDGHVRALRRRHVEHREIRQAHALDAHALAIVEHDSLGPALDVTLFALVRQKIIPPRLALPVHFPLAAD